jgi:hypothetical protein
MVRSDIPVKDNLTSERDDVPYGASIRISTVSISTLTTSHLSRSSLACERSCSPGEIHSSLQGIVNTAGSPVYSNKIAKLQSMVGGDTLGYAREASVKPSTKGLEARV